MRQGWLAGVFLLSCGIPGRPGRLKPSEAVGRTGLENVKDGIQFAIHTYEK